MNRRTFITATGTGAAVFAARPLQASAWPDRFSPVIYTAAIRQLTEALNYARVNKYPKAEHYHNIATSVSTLYEHLHEIGAFAELEQLLREQQNFILGGDLTTIDAKPLVQAYANHGCKVSVADVHRQFTGIPYAQKAFMYRFVRQYGMRAVMQVNGRRLHQLGDYETARLESGGHLQLAQYGTCTQPDANGDQACCAADPNAAMVAAQMNYAAMGMGLVGSMWGAALLVPGAAATCAVACGVGVGIGLIGGFIGLLVNGTQIPTGPSGESVPVIP